jgi:signal transduction histidine kinase
VSATAPAPPPGRAARALARVGVGRLLGLSIGVLLVAAGVGIVLALLANERLSDRRALLVDGVSPALTLAFRVENALVDEQTAVRGYQLTGEERFLEPYRAGRRTEDEAYRDFAALARGADVFAPRVAAVRRSAALWRTDYVAPVLAGRPPPETTGRTRFGDVRAAMTALQGDLQRRRAEARADLFGAADDLRDMLITAAALVLVSVIGAGLLLWSAVTRPLGRLRAEARRVAAGRFEEPLELLGGPRELVQTGRDVEAMRERIVRELAAVDLARSRIEEQAAELARSNADLEQFAYVASHDLQEPLRKIASFCQILERRYRGRLDERADQYIDFIVDGARRMQALINDLLAFSRVGRRGGEMELVDLDDVVEHARSGLQTALQEAGATVTVGRLPVVRGERALLVAVFQNLIGNAVKFRGEDPPVVRITARDAGDDWEIACADDGIGIAPEFAERIFVIFQRLHTREAYEGTGIGLALCRKIVEYHGGRIWLDTERPRGTCFRFTLPKADEEEP